jgi:L-fuculose-phosphate aldolase
VLGALGLARGATGHVSARLPATNRLFIRARGPESAVRKTTIDHIIEVDSDGDVVHASAGLAAPFEVFIHTAIMRARPDVHAVVHAHPAKVVLFTVCDTPLQPIYGAFDPRGLDLALDGIPTYPRSILVSTPELGAEFAGVMGEANACLLRGHGIATAGRSVEEATLDAIALNELAIMNYEAHLLGEPRDIADDDKALRVACQPASPASRARKRRQRGNFSSR